MSKLSLGIVGLPNVGKSTLFNALLKKQLALAANYPFATIEPNIGVVDVPDARLSALATCVNAQKTIPAIVEFYDIAGLVKGASEGEGLGNQFLSHIREVSAIVYVSRVFHDKDILHVYDTVDPQRDLQIVESELIMADLQTVSKQNDRKPPILPPSITIKLTTEVWSGIIAKLKTHLDQGNPVRTLDLSDEERLIVHTLNLLTIKPTLYVYNISEDQLRESSEHGVEAFLKKHNIQSAPDKCILLNAKLESDLASFGPEEAAMLQSEYGLARSGLDTLISYAYDTLGLMSYLTAGEKEVRAWTIRKHTTAVEAAGEIHTDFIKGFVKADIVSYEDFIRIGGWSKAREQGLVNTVGKEHLMKDGDVVEFKIASH